MPYSFVDLFCSCNGNKKYQNNSHDNDEYLEDFKCQHFRVTAFKRNRSGWLLGFDQLAGLYFTITCLNCRKEEKFSYESKTFGKEDKDYKFVCCNNTLAFQCRWAH